MIFARRPFVKEHLRVHRFNDYRHLASHLGQGFDEQPDLELENEVIRLTDMGAAHGLEPCSGSANSAIHSGYSCL